MNTSYAALTRDAMNKAFQKRVDWLWAATLFPPDYGWAYDITYCAWMDDGWDNPAPSVSL